MVWSGVTKCLTNMVQLQKKSLEIANFGIFGPIFDHVQGRDPNDKGFANTQRLAAMKLGMSPAPLSPAARSPRNPPACCRSSSRPG